MLLKLHLPKPGTASSSLLLLALNSSSASVVSMFRSLCWFCWCIIAAIEKFVIFDNAAAVDIVEPWFAISIFPFKSEFGEDDGSGELEGLADVGFVGEGNA